MNRAIEREHSPLQRESQMKVRELARKMEAKKKEEAAAAKKKKEEAEAAAAAAAAAAATAATATAVRVPSACILGPG